MSTSNPEPRIPAFAYLELVQNLEVDRVEVAQSHVLQRVLERVQRRGYGQLPPVPRED